MPAVDFRTRPYDKQRLERSASYVGRGSYHRLYAAENLIRVLTASILTAQLGPKWWDLAVDPTLQGQAKRFAARYAARPWYSTQGSHGIYFLFLTDLAEIMRANRNHFDPLVPDLDSWLIKIEDIALPRNIVGHMNWPSPNDVQRIRLFHADVSELARHVASKGVTLVIP